MRFHAFSSPVCQFRMKAHLCLFIHTFNRRSFPLDHECWKKTMWVGLWYIGLEAESLFLHENLWHNIIYRAETWDVLGRIRLQVVFTHRIYSTQDGRAHYHVGFTYQITFGSSNTTRKIVLFLSNLKISRDDLIKCVSLLVCVCILGAHLHKQRFLLHDSVCLIGEATRNAHTT